MTKAQLLKNVLLSVLLPLSLGILAILPVITSENGYVAGFVFLPLIILILLASLGLLIASLIATGINGRRGLWVLLSGPMLLCGFFGGAMIAKQFEIGAYREEPMIQFPPPIANKVLFNTDATHEQIEALWTDVLGYRTGETSSCPRPGIEAIARTESENGHEVITFSFRANATEEQKADIRNRINSYAPVSKYLEDVPTASENSPSKSQTNSNVEAKKVRIHSISSNH